MADMSKIEISCHGCGEGSFTAQLVDETKVVLECQNCESQTCFVSAFGLEVVEQ